MIISLGDSGFSVFQAGHCDWQRPHSVQAMKSTYAFQVKSWMRPLPKVGVVGRVLEVDRGALRTGWAAGGRGRSGRREV